MLSLQQPSGMIPVNLPPTRRTSGNPVLKPKNHIARNAAYCKMLRNKSTGLGSSGSQFVG
ncbi:hypothetical protein ACTXT7_010019 [Hymenolepis weldensis]